ncbi:hypothetical protein FOMG_18538 [Fusarium oxysporum f. sp. melonis 26406]|uniref:Uncharacterized protein n=1 Tax=Fusarium oxysporum f. sp. melonis 26406 TaxID=1089452 RepID=W9ZUH2_FUSOX|nr:hypothetical protein FOMG_18538 [Fusarium oxysporum f. sp. melonis 26406]
MTRKAQLDNAPPFNPDASNSHAASLQFAFYRTPPCRPSYKPPSTHSLAVLHYASENIVEAINPIIAFLSVREKVGDGA